ncbi:RDD family protein [Reichenbachiella sp.]|uniref:RDD family protein n=1 Tax=Reichenbachiella sp. TaxID=2184521 RepID=UPI003BB1865E
MKVLFLLQYNVLSKAYLSFIESSIPLTNRLKSMMFDFALSGVPIALLIPLVAIEKFTFNTDYVANFLIPVCFVFVMIIKDRDGGRSIGKRLTGFVIVDSKSNDPASKVQCIVRNLTFPLWPIEALLLLGTPESRLGDFVAGTKVVSCEPGDPKEMGNQN